VAEHAEWDVGDQPEDEEGVAPPKEQVSGSERIASESGQAKSPRQPVAHRRPDLEGRVSRTQDSEPLNEEPGDGDENEGGPHDYEISSLLKPVGLDYKLKSYSRKTTVVP
jgi:hypothetical protein